MEVQIFVLVSLIPSVFLCIMGGTSSGMINLLIQKKGGNTSTRIRSYNCTKKLTTENYYNCVSDLKSGIHRKSLIMYVQIIMETFLVLSGLKKMENSRILVHKIKKIIK